MYSIDDQHESYSRLVRIEDWRFDELIAGIRCRQYAGELTLREARTSGSGSLSMAAHMQAIQEANAPVPGGTDGPESARLGQPGGIG